MKHFVKYVFVSFVLLLFTCSPKRTIDRQNTNLYKKNNIDIDVKYVLCHETDTTSRLYYSINNAELTYKKGSNDSVYTAVLKLFCELKPDAKSKIILDTLTLTIKDKQQEVKQGKITGSRLLKTKGVLTSHLFLQLKDINRKAMNETEILVNKTTKLSAQNFIFKEYDSTIVYDAYSSKTQTLFYKNTRVSSDISYVSFSGSVKSLPAPPFSTYEIKPDPITYESTTKNYADLNSWFSLKLNKEGVYFVRLDSLVNVGCALYLFPSGFPKVSTHQAMIESVRYITSADEYDNLILSKNQQKAIEDFWIGIAGNTERAKQLIKKYYGRVQIANEQFSTYKEGWRTDRGMIYIIYGSPDSFYEGSNQEVWIYGQEGSPYSTTFRFDKEQHILSDNVYNLRRDPALKNPWYMAVDAWREGRIYSEN